MIGNNDDFDMYYILIETDYPRHILELLSHGCLRPMTRDAIEVLATWTEKRLFKKQLVYVLVTGVQADLEHIKNYAHARWKKRKYPRVYGHSFKLEMSPVDFIKYIEREARK